MYSNYLMLLAFFYYDHFKPNGILDYLQLALCLASKAPRNCTKPFGYWQTVSISVAGVIDVSTRCQGMWW